MNNLKKFWKKFWFVVWEDPSFKGWLISIIFIFVMIKFVFFPVLNLTTGTSQTLAIVESCSMYHKGDVFSEYDSWWERNQKQYSKFGIGKNEFSEFIFKKGFNKGDLLFMIKANPEKLKNGDVILFEGTNKPIIHRLIKINEDVEGKIFSTQGDNNDGQLEIEKEIREKQLIGKALFKIPFAGWIKLVFYEPLRPEYERGFCDER